MFKNIKAFSNFWLTKSKIVEWKKNPKITFIKKKSKFFWFPDGKINIFYNCVVKNLSQKLNKKKALIFVTEQGKESHVTYEELYKLINKYSSFFVKHLGRNLNNKKIMIHASASRCSALTMLCCAKLGIHFSVVFSELENEAIISRVKLFNPDLFISNSLRFHFKKKYPEFTKIIKKTFFFNEIDFTKLKELKGIKYFNSNHKLFTLFTSGSTGVPKGITHSSGGYLVYSKLTCQKQFGMNKKSVVLTASDAGWINGHTYALFGPLSFGATTILLEKPISFLNIKILKKILSTKITILYLPVTLIRLLKSLYEKLKIKKHHIKVLGSMGEPLASSVANWFANFFVLTKKSIVNTYFQTETGGIICSPTYKDTIDKTPHGSVGKPINNFINLSKLNKKFPKEIFIKNPWPGCMIDVINGKKEWKKYWTPEGYFKLFDLGYKIKNNIFVTGRADDVINISGHRLGSGEVEAVILKIKEIKECSAINVDDPIYGSKMILFVVTAHKNLDNEINKKLISNFGSFALPKNTIYLSALPKTRSGKILRRVLRNIYIKPKNNNYGDTSTMLNPEIIEEIKEKIKIS